MTPYFGVVKSFWQQAKCLDREEPQSEVTSPFNAKRQLRSLNQLAAIDLP
jgi:hypothetical protein